MDAKFLIVGAGFSGCVLANRLIKQLDCTIDIIDERSHIGGNCHTSRDEETGIMVHHYGPHIFNTDKKEIWDFVNSFVEFRPYVHRVKARVNDKVFPLPINLMTINQYFGKVLDPKQAEIFLNTLADHAILHPTNFEDQALAFIGEELYRAFFYGYTKKQWGCEPRELPASILKRIPVRFNYDDNYHPHPYTGIPVEGYSAVMEKMVDNPAIKLHLNRKFIPGELHDEYNHIFYTGPLDTFFQFCFGRLGYRTVTFERNVQDGDFQGTAQMNFCDEEVPYTRISEHKHFTPWEKHNKTVYFKEFSHETTPQDEPYYPKRLDADKKILARYRKKAEGIKGVSFLGRLATYRYMDMHNVIDEAMSFAVIFADAFKTGEPLPIFPNTEDKP